MSTKIEPAVNDDAENGAMRRVLARRMAFAGLMIAMLLASLAFFDYVSTPPPPEEEPVAVAPRFTEPVPVGGKKEVAQAVTPAEQPSETAAPGTAALPGAQDGNGEKAAATTTAAVPAESSAAPVDRTVVESPAVPPAPLVAAQPALPAPSRPSAPPPARGPAVSARDLPPPPALPAPASAPHAASSAAIPAPASRTTTAAAVPVPPVAATRPASEERVPPRLFSGYAVQAGVFADVRRAEELHAQLMLSGIPSTLEARVNVGPFKTRAEAEAARRKLKELGIEGLLLPPRSERR